jgi:hypothetical protein
LPISTVVKQKRVMRSETSQLESALTLAKQVAWAVADDWLRLWSMSEADAMDELVPVLRGLDPKMGPFALQRPNTAAAPVRGVLQMAMS